jgi:hypothetical protein
MHCQAVDINRIVRRMRGGSQAYLVEGNDRRFYVAKFAGNPQGNRTLINEWITTHLLQRLDVSTPSLVVLRLNRQTRKAAESLCFQLGTRSITIEPGLHLGSLCPADPRIKPIYDFLPQSFLAKISNLADFAKTLVVDVFLAQADLRQAIFVREGSKDSLGFRAYLIDHGRALGGSTWELRDLHSHGFYCDRKIYSMMDTASIAEIALRSLATITEGELCRMLQDVPREWFAPGDYAALERLITLLQRRKDRLPSLVLKQLGTLAISHSSTPNDCTTAEEISGERYSGQPNQPLAGIATAVAQLSLNLNVVFPQ